MKEKLADEGLRSMIGDLIAERRELVETNRVMAYDPYGWQKVFHRSKDEVGNFSRQRAVIAGNKTGKCVSYQTLIDTPSGKVPAGELKVGDEVYSFSGEGKRVRGRIGQVVKKPPEMLWRVTLSNGEWFECADRHRILTSSGNWVFFSSVRTFAGILQWSTSGSFLSESPVDVQRLMQRVQDSLADCPEDRRSCDEPPPSSSGSDPASSPSQDDAQQHNRDDSRWDDLDGVGTYTLFDMLHRLSNGSDDDPDVVRLIEFVENTLGSDEQPCQRKLQDALRLLFESTDRLQSFFGVEPDRVPVFSLMSPDEVKGVHIVGYEPVGVNDLYDFWVPDYHCYVAAGVVHHNTYCGAMEMAIHLTGLYPDWWEGRRWNSPIKAWAAGNTITNTRDIVQAELLGEPGDSEDFGKGTIPRDLIIGSERWPGIPNGLSQVRVKHVTGRTSTLYFKAYEQGKDAWMGKAIDLIWLDEEPPQDIYSQALRASLKGAGSVYLTFTPEKGMTEVVAQFLNDLREGQLLVRASWKDAPHLDEQTRAEILAALPPHEREMRSKGIPVLGSGLVFPVSEDGIRVPSFKIPEHWARIAGIDFGWDHPTAVVWVAWDRDTDKCYIYDCYRAGQKTVVDHSAVIKTRGTWIPVVWPHDGMQSDKGSGKPLAQQYKDQGIEMMAEHFANPGGGNAVEPGVQAILTRMQSNTFFVFDHLTDWFTEFRQYHRQDGKIVKRNDDLMSATRYAVQSLRFARTLNFAPRPDLAEGTDNWNMFA